ncbi:shikimate kinase [Oscillospiraceae bacterium]|nr:shikimate kinase [Oscillospiraceae bacterium]BDF77147.1 shikimate kinase [Oscillospiraceae bacterium]
MKNITLIGMPGSGKSTVGVLLAKVLGYNFLDVDLLIQQREGALLQEILNERGTERFLDAEAEAICSVECPAPTVIAPGGSAVCRAQAMEHLKALGTVVYLRLSYGDLEGRIHNLGSRGIAMEPGQTLRDIYDYRAHLYEAYADRVADVGGSTLEQALAAVLRTLVAGE